MGLALAANMAVVAPFLGAYHSPDLRLATLSWERNALSALACYNTSTFVWLPRGVGVALTSLSKLLHTKITPPPPRRALLSRDRLLALLDGGLEQPVILIAAGAGFGKSTLVAQWLRTVADRARVAWLSLDADDNDPARFWSYVLGALERAIPGVSAEASELLHGPQTGATESVIAALLNRLQHDELPLLLALDDYHLITQPEIHRSLAYAIDHLPAHVHVVITTRTDPPLPLSRWRARDQLVELRAEQLRFTLDEAHAFLSGLMGLAVAPEQTAALEARTEGWVAGLHLAALSLRGQRDPKTFIAAFAASHRTALDYLIEEVFAHQPAHIQRFLLQTSVLDQFSPALCDALLGVAQPIGEPWSRLLLDDLEQQNLFLIPLDAERGWYRYHHLFAAALRQRLQRSAPEQLPELHRRAARWLAAQGLGDAAIDHALAAGEQALAADLVEQAATRAWERGETATLQRWLDALPTAVAEQRPALLLWRAWLALMLPDIDALARAVQQAEQAMETAEPSDSPRRGELLALQGWLARIRGDAAKSYALSMRALALLRPDDAYWRATVGVNATQAAWAQGDLAAARARVAEAVAHSERAANGSLLALARSTEAWMHVHAGQLARAETICADTLARAAERGQSQLPMHAFCHVVLAEVSLLCDALGEAQQRADAALTLLAGGVLKDALLRALHVQLGVAQARGDTAAIERLLAQIERESRATGAAALELQLRAQRAWIVLAQGDALAAAALLEGVDLSAPTGVRTNDAARLAVARLRIAQGRAQEALDLLDGELHIAALCGIPVALLGPLVRSLALHAAGRSVEAGRVLSEAIARAAPEGCVRPFREIGEPLRPLLQAQRAADGGGADTRGFVEQLLAERPEPGPAGAPSALQRADGPTHTLVEPLSARELEVLALLAEGATNQQIAGRLFITERTAKKHVTNILGKLDAANRTQAVALARSAGLLA